MVVVFLTVVCVVSPDGGQGGGSIPDGGLCCKS